MSVEEGLRRAPAFVAKHGEELPLGVELGRVGELFHEIAGDAVNMHVCPTGSLSIARIGYLTEDRDHPQFFQKGCVEGNFVHPIDDLAGRAGRTGPLDGVHLHEDRVFGNRTPERAG